MTNEPGTPSLGRPDGDMDPTAPPEEPAVSTAPGTAEPPTSEATAEAADQREPPGRPKPTTIAEFIDYAYGHKGLKVHLARRDLRELVLRPESAASEMDVLRKAAAVDPLLSVPPRILAVLAESGPDIAVRRRILELVLAALVSHPVFAPFVMSIAEPAATPALSSTQVSEAASQVTAASLGLELADFRESARERLRVNAVTSFVLFGVLRDGWTLERFVTEMASTVWAAPPMDHSRSRVAQHAAALASSRDTDVLRLLVQHFGGVLKESREQTRQARGDAAREARRAEHLAEVNRDLSETIESQRSHIQALVDEVEALKRVVDTERSSRVVDKSHHVDDYETLRTQVIRRLSAQTELLSDGLHALRNGSPAVADEFLDRSLSAIAAEVNRLKDLAGGTR